VAAPGGVRLSAAACLPVLELSVDERVTDPGDNEQVDERGPGEGLAVVDQVDDPDDESGRREQEVPEEDGGPEMARTASQPH
jgi:hypothetical protein